MNDFLITARQKLAPGLWFTPPSVLAYVDRHSSGTDMILGNPPWKGETMKHCNYFDPSAAERAEQEAQPEPRQPCGHPTSAIRCELEDGAAIGTCYCWLCCHAEQQEEVE